MVLLGCVPEGPASKEEPQRGSARTPPAGASRGLLHATKPDPAITSEFADDFNRRYLGGAWRPLSSVWRIEDNQLCGRIAKNRGVWLRRRLPVNARIEFDATSSSRDGDIKAELWGDGRTGATKVSYTEATSYLPIFGGWKNTRHVLARINEHGKDRRSLLIDPQAQDPRARPVVKGQRYRFKIERADGQTVSWSVDGQLMHEMRDPKPLKGPGHDHFGFNTWTVRVCFDNLKITPL